MTTPAPLAVPASPAVGSRIVVTVAAAAAVVLVERHVPLPFIRQSALLALGDDVELVSVGALGIAPILEAWVLVELSALIYSPWGALRSTPEGRGRLRSRAYSFAALFALAQSAMITVALSRVRMANGPLLTSTGIVTLFALSATLMGGVAVYLAMAELVDRRGLGSGIALLAGTGILARLWSNGALHLQGLNPPAAFALAGAAVVAAAWLQSGGAVMAFAPKSLPGARVRHPVAGLVPLRIGSASLLLAATWAAAAPAGTQIAESLAPGTSSYAATWAAVSIALAALFAWRLAQPRHVAAMWARAGVGEAASNVTQAHAVARRAVLVSACFAGALIAVGHGFQVTNGTVLFVGEVVMLGALLADLWLEIGARRERPDLVAVWPLSRPYEMEPAIALLAREGITAFPRNARWYGVMPVLAAYAPVTLLVPAADAERASASLRAVFGGD